jgi:hypothetical protein
MTSVPRRLVKTFLTILFCVATLAIIEATDNACCGPGETDWNCGPCDNNWQCTGEVLNQITACCGGESERPNVVTMPNTSAAGASLATAGESAATHAIFRRRTADGVSQTLTSWLAEWVHLMATPNRLIATFGTLVTVLQMSFASLAAGQQPQLATAAITGQVTAGESGKPLPFAQVKLTGGKGFTSDTLTGADGRYRFEGLPPGRYTLAFSKAGFVTLRFGQSLPSDPFTRLDIRPGQYLREIDAALPRASAIEGRVVDENGDPLAEATAAAIRIKSDSGQRRFVKTGRTSISNDRGEYRIFGLPPGDYTVSVSSSQTTAPFTNDPKSPSMASGKGVATIYYASTPNVNDADVVTLRPGQDASGINILFRATRLVTISGTVVPASGKILDGALVSLIRADGPALLGMSRVSGDGTFRLDRIPPGSYILQVRSVPTSTVNAVAMTGKSAALTASGNIEFGNLPIVVGSVDVEGVIVPIAPAGRIQGRVLLDGKLFEPGDARVSVAALPTGPESMSAGSTAMPVRTDGTFDIGGVLGSFVLRLSASKSDLALRQITYNGSDTTDHQITVSPGQEVSGLSIELTRAAAVIAGQAGMNERTELQDWVVLAFSTDEKKWILPSTRYIETTRFLTNGEFRLSGLPPGGYFVAAAQSKDRHQFESPAFLKTLSKAAITVNIASGQTSPVFLQVGPSK